MADKELMVKLKLQDEATAKLNGFGSSLNKFTKDAKKALSPFSQYKTVLTRLGIAWGVTFGGMAKAVSMVSDEIDNLDKMSIKLHTTTEQLSMRKYGFNIATENALIAKGQAASVKERSGGFIQSFGSGIMNFWGAITKDNRAKHIFSDLQIEERKRLGRNTTNKEDALLWEKSKNMAPTQLVAEQKDRKERSQEALQAEVDLTSKIDQLSLSSVQLKKKRFDEEIGLYKLAGAKESEIIKLQSAYEKSEDRDRNIQLMKMDAMTLAAKGRTQEAMNMQDKAALEEFKKIWGEDSEMVDAFKRGQEAIRAQKSLFVQTMQDVAGAMTDTLANNFTSFRGFMEDFGQEVLSIGKKIAAQFIITQTLGRFIPGFNVLGSKFHSGGVVRAHSGLAVDEVPIIAQTGEGVLSRRGMSSLGRGNFDRLNRGENIGGRGVVININPVVHAWDAQDIKRNEKMFVGVVGAAISSNSQLRELIRRYS